MRTCLLVGTAFLLSSCALPGMFGMGYDNAGILTGGLVQGRYRVQLVECLGNASSQNVTAILAVTNTGPDSHQFIGGSLDGSVAVDMNGYTAKPYDSAGVQYDLPSGVTVRVEIPRIEPVRPGTPMFQSLTVTVGSGQGNSVRFRNVPITWTN
jgi:hypothetical protein